MRYLRAVARVWISILGYAALVGAIGGIFAMGAVVAHGAFGVSSEPLAPIVFVLTLVTTGAVLVESRR